MTFLTCQGARPPRAWMGTGGRVPARFEWRISRWVTKFAESVSAYSLDDRRRRHERLDLQPDGQQERARGRARIDELDRVHALRPVQPDERSFHRSLGYDEAHELVPVTHDRPERVPWCMACHAPRGSRPSRTRRPFAQIIASTGCSCRQTTRFSKLSATSWSGSSVSQRLRRCPSTPRVAFPPPPPSR